jgi:hypothetical protein
VQTGSAAERYSASGISHTVCRKPARGSADGNRFTSGLPHFLNFPSADRRGSFSSVALVRILVDGYSLLHAWPEIAPGKPRHSQAARDELIHWLTQYRDAIGTPITIFFDGGGAPAGTSGTRSTPELEVLFSKSGQTADDMIERTAHRLRPYGELLVVTDDYAERETILSLGGMASSCANFINDVEAALAEMNRDLRRYNLRERNQFARSRRK